MGWLQYRRKMSTVKYTITINEQMYWMTFAIFYVVCQPITTKYNRKV